MKQLMTIRLFAISMILASLAAGAATVDAPSREALAGAGPRFAFRNAVASLCYCRQRASGRRLTVLRAWGGRSLPFVEAPARVLDVLAASSTIDCLALERTPVGDQQYFARRHGVELVNIGEDLGDGRVPTAIPAAACWPGIFRLRLRLGQSFLRRRRRPLPDRACSPLRRRWRRRSVRYSR